MAIYEPLAFYEHMDLNKLPVLYKEAIPVLYRVRHEGMAGFIIVDGVPGVGKTTLGLQLCDFFEGEEVIISNYILTGVENFKNEILLAHERKQRVVVFDEAGGFHRKGALSRLNRDLNSLFDQVRALNMVIVLILPFMDALDREIFDKQLPRILYHCYKKDVKKGRSYAKVYSIEEMFYLKHYFSKLINKPKAYQFVKPISHGVFKDLPSARRDALHKYSLDEKKKINSKLSNLYTVKDIATHFNKSAEWVYMQIKKFKEKPQTKVGKTQYFTGALIEKIEADRE